MNDESTPPHGTPPSATGIASEPPRAPAFIVTIYGDVVEPRGGMLWMGTLIECCARHGLNESLVRTAASRLVGAGQLEGVRNGRRSYYGLTDAARAEFRDAARLLFNPPPTPQDWLICLSQKAGEHDLPLPWARFGPTVWIAPNREDLRPPEGVLLRARQLEGYGEIDALAAERWGLEEVARQYASFLQTHAPLRDTAMNGAALSPGEALAFRLRLVHDYRQAALNDPRLPRSAYPPDWPGEAARALFVDAYTRLSNRAEDYVGQAFQGVNGSLPARNDTTERRLFAIRREAVGGG